ncbi:MAG: hypothetical protein M5U21_12245 [Fimbriimonadaceae bacterium]|nr:hypothetical protein [Fimbriimonadaceae bacterium]
MKLAVQFQSRVTQVLLKNSSNQTVRTQTWTYDPASNVLTHTTGGVQTSYGYDDIDQLVSESRNGYSASYTYDANGNRLTRTVNSVTEDYVYDDADKLLEVKIGQQTVKEFTYDSAGRTTAVETSAGTTSLAYDYESRVTGITYPNQSTNSFTYNGLDTRVGMSDSGGSKTFLRDGVSVTSPVLSDGSATYTPAISERRSSTTTFYHAGIKNGDSQTNTSESVTASVQYDAFGNVTSSSGTWQGPFAYGGPYGYQSDPDSGLKLLGHRYYDPSTGRFLTRDPIKDGRNWYGYCRNNGPSLADPTGLGFLSDLWEGAKDWYFGIDVIGPGGEPVRVGGWPALFNRKQNAMTVNETVHLNDPDDYVDYLNDSHWSRHEKMHIYQEETYHDGNAISFVATVIVQYLLALSHDGAPYEVEAELATTRRWRPDMTGYYEWYLGTQ